jgi:hypothetical protein
MIDTVQSPSRKSFSRTCQERRVYGGFGLMSSSSAPVWKTEVMTPDRLNRITIDKAHAAVAPAFGVCGFA